MLLNRLMLLCLLVTSSTLTTSAMGAQEAEVSDGSPISFADGKAWITPPQNWEIQKNRLGKALILQEPKGDKVVYSKPTYQRNITVAVSHQGTPIDAVTVKNLREKLTESFGKFGKDFVLADNHEFFDYRNEKDGILIYSFFKVNGFDLTQLHVFVSGKNESILATYTDLSDRFEKDQAIFDQVWASIASVQLEGVPENRLKSLYTIGGTVGGLLILVVLAFSIRGYRAKKSYEMEEDVLFTDDGELEDETLESEMELLDTDGDEFSSLPETKLASVHPATSW